jgi:hypothetical protein
MPGATALQLGRYEPEAFEAKLMVSGLARSHCEAGPGQVHLSVRADQAWLLRCGSLTGCSVGRKVLAIPATLRAL